MFKRPYFLLLTLSLALISCNTKERVARNHQAARAWLSANPCSGNTRVAGNWKCEDPAWGSVKLKQSGSHVTGSMGMLTLEGNVQGKDLYFVISDKNVARYSAILRKRGQTLSGFYSAHLPFSTKDQKTLLLKRSVN